MKIFEILLITVLSASLLLVVGTSLHGFIFDIEPRDLNHEYEVEEGWKQEPITFEAWLERQEHFYDKIHDWVIDEFVESFDPWHFPEPETPYHSERD